MISGRGAAKDMTNEFTKGKTYPGSDECIDCHTVRICLMVSRVQEKKNPHVSLPAGSSTRVFVMGDSSLAGSRPNGAGKDGAWLEAGVCCCWEDGSPLAATAWEFMSVREGLRLICLEATWLLDLGFRAVRDCDDG